MKIGLGRKSDFGKSEKNAVKVTAPKIAKNFKSPLQRVFKNRTDIFPKDNPLSYNFLL